MQALESLEQYYGSCIPSARKFKYDESGVGEIPFSNKKWVETTNGVELKKEAGLLWPPTVRYMDKRGLFHRRLRRYSNGIEWLVIWATVRNTLALSKAAGMTVQEKAIYTTITKYVRDETNCPLPIIGRLSETMSYIALALIDEHSDKAVDEIATLSVHRPKGATDKEIRKRMYATLRMNGISNCRTRAEQEAVIDKVLGYFPNLKDTARDNIHRYLRSHRMLRNKFRKFYNEEERASEIKNKMESGIALTGAERYFKCTHKELF